MAQLIDRSISFHALNKQNSMPMIFVDGWLSRLHNVESESPSFTLQLFKKIFPTFVVKKWKSHKSWARKQLFLVYISVARGSPSQNNVAISLELKTANITSTIFSAGESPVQSFALALLFSFSFNLDSLLIPQILETTFFFFFKNIFNFIPLLSKLTAIVVDNCSLLPVGCFSSYFLTPDQKAKTGQTSLQRKSPC